MVTHYRTERAMARRAAGAPVGGRPETHRARARDEILGTAFSDHDLVVFLEGA
jgi:hypothetical protein